MNKKFLYICIIFLMGGCGGISQKPETSQARDARHHALCIQHRFKPGTKVFHACMETQIAQEQDEFSNTQRTPRRTRTRPKG